MTPLFGRRRKKLEAPQQATTPAGATASGNRSIAIDTGGGDFYGTAQTGDNAADFAGRKAPPALFAVGFLLLIANLLPILLGAGTDKSTPPSGPTVTPTAIGTTSATPGTSSAVGPGPETATSRPPIPTAQPPPKSTNGTKSTNGRNGVPPSSTTTTNQSPPTTTTTTPTGKVYYSGTLAYDGSSDGKPYDLDYSPPMVFGPNNTLNLVANEIDVVVPNGAKAAPSWTASSLPGKQQCVNALAHAPGDFPGIYQGLAVGTTFCFQTAGARYGAVRVTDASAHYVSSVIVWS